MLWSFWHQFYQIRYLKQNYADIPSNSVSRGKYSYQIMYLNFFLQNVVFQNFAYEYNSFIELNSQGGIISMKGVTFDNMNSCGAIIRNKKALVTKTTAANTIVTYYE